MPQEGRRGAAKAESKELGRNQLGMEGSGADTDGHEFKNAEEMWREHVGNPTKRTEWYREGVGYWQGVEASVDGVLGGYGHVNDADILGSEVFLKSILVERFSFAGKDRPLVALGISLLTHFLIFSFHHFCLSLLWMSCTF